MNDQNEKHNPALDPALLIHPYAAAFPMLGPEMMAEKALDIKINGLIHPIVLSNDQRMLIDGRNRLAACKLAGVEPRWITFAMATKNVPGTTVIGFIRSQNCHRRQLGPSKCAALVAQATAALKNVDVLPEPTTANPEQQLSVDDLTDGERERLESAVEASKSKQTIKAETSAASIAAKNKEKAKRGRQASEKRAETKADAKQAGVSEATMRRTKELQESRPDLFALIDDDQNTVGKLHDQMKSEELSAKRAEGIANLIEQLQETESKQFVEAVKREELLETPEQIRQFMDATDSVKVKLRELLSKSWKFPKALQFAMFKPSMKSTVQELTGIAAVSGGAITLEVGEYQIEIKPITAK